MIETYIKLSLQNFHKFKKKKRNLTLILILSFFLFTFFFSFFGTLLSNLKTYWGDMLFGSGTIVIKEVQEYDIFKSLEKKNYFSYDKLNNINQILLTPRLRVSALLEGYESENEVVCILIGVDVEKELKLTPGVYVSEGRYPIKGKNEICFYPGLAGSLNVEVGDEVIIYTNTTDGYMNYDLVKVVGILDSRDVQYFYGGQTLAYVPLHILRKLHIVDSDQVTEVGFRVDSFLERIKLNWTLPKELKIINFWESTKILYSLHWMYTFFNILLLSLILIVVFSTVYHNDSPPICRTLS